MNCRKYSVFILIIFLLTEIPSLLISAPNTNKNSNIPETIHFNLQNLIVPPEINLKEIQLLELIIKTSVLKGNTSIATKKLDKLIPELKDPLVREAAKILKLQIKGDFRKLNRVWLNKKVRNMVVLVPDELSFIDTIKDWKEDEFWPVLIEDGWFSSIFIKAFTPSKVMRKQVKNIRDIKSEVCSIADTYNNYLTEKTFSDFPGIVIVDPDDKERVAGLALAFARRQPIWIKHINGNFKDVLSPEKVKEINSELLEQMDKWRLLKNNLWKGITIAGDWPSRWNGGHRFGQGIAWSCVDDALGRKNDGLRIGVTGRLIGSPARSVYQAMCSLFLQPSKILLWDLYSRIGGDMKFYRFDKSLNILKNTNLSYKRYLKDDIAPWNFFRITRTRPYYDLFFINSSGGSYSFSCGEGRGYPEDIPIGRVSWFHVIISGGGAAPTDPLSIPGRALSGGACWYFGSISEPYLQAFERPHLTFLRAFTGTPLAFAVRKLPGYSFYKPWKLILYGDPLFILREKIQKRLPWIKLSGYIPAKKDNKFNNVCVLRDKNLIPYAEEAIEKPENISPAHQAWALYNLMENAIVYSKSAPKKGNSKYNTDLFTGLNLRILKRKQINLVANCPLKIAKAYPMSRAIVFESAELLFREAVANGDIVMASRYLKPLLSLYKTSARVIADIKAWIITARKQGRQKYITRRVDGLLKEKSFGSREKYCINKSLAVLFNVFDENDKIVPVPYTPSSPSVISSEKLTDIFDIRNKSTLVDSVSCNSIWHGKKLLKTNNSAIEIDIPIEVGSEYTIEISLLSLKPQKLKFYINSEYVRQDILSKCGWPKKVTIRTKKLTPPKLTLKISGETIFYISGIRFSCNYKPIPPENWHVIGPFRSLWTGDGEKSAETVRQSLNKVFPPESGVSLKDSYTDFQNKKIVWIKPKKTHAFRGDCGVNFTRTLGVEKSGICYAATNINVDKEQTAWLWIGCDWWGRAFLNGKVLKSDRPEKLKKKDGADFNGFKAFRAKLHLKKGRNILLVKIQGGSGGSGFTAFISK